MAVIAGCMRGYFGTYVMLMFVICVDHDELRAHTLRNDRERLYVIGEKDFCQCRKLNDSKGEYQGGFCRDF